MLPRILLRSLTRRLPRALLATLTIWLGISLVTALLTISLDVRDRMNLELTSYGANIRVEPAGAAVPVRVGGYELSDRSHREWLDQERVRALDSIFWRNNILGVVSRLWTTAVVDGREAPLLGLSLDEAEGLIFETDARKQYDHWRIDGAWPEGDGEILAGVDAAGRLGLSTGSTIGVKVGDSPLKPFRVSGIASTGGREDGALIAALDTVQELGGLAGKVSELDVNALTTPENKLAEKYALDPQSLTPVEYERWACTPYPGSVASEIQNTIDGSSARVVRRVSETQGTVLRRIEGLMVVLGSIAAVVCCLSVVGVLTSAILNRGPEIALMRAIGAERRGVWALFMLEAAILGLVGGALAGISGSLLGAYLVRAVFDGAAEAHGVFMLLSPLLGLLAALLACLAPVSRVLGSDPARVLQEA